MALSCGENFTQQNSKYMQKSSAYISLEATLGYPVISSHIPGFFFNFFFNESIRLSPEGSLRL